MVSLGSEILLFYGRSFKVISLNAPSALPLLSCILFSPHFLYHIVLLMSPQESARELADMARQLSEHATGRNREALLDLAHQLVNPVVLIFIVCLFMLGKGNLEQLLGYCLNSLPLLMFFR